MLPPKMMIALWALLAASLIAASAAKAQTVWYVNDDGDADNGCTSWLDACPELQTALSLAGAGDQIWVAEGTYRPDYNTNTDQHTGDREASFHLISGVAIYGGFDATEQTLGDRAGLFDQTILSGDLIGDDDPQNPGGSGGDCCGNHEYPGCGDDACEAAICQIEEYCCKSWDPVCVLIAEGVCCELCSDNVTVCENSFHVVTDSGTASTASLDGFTISAGNPIFPVPNYNGGGMYIEGGSPRITNCTFKGNEGGGMFSEGGAPTLSDCTFSDNGGMGFSSHETNLTATNCTFSRNEGRGMGISQGMVKNCTFVENGGGGLQIGSGPMKVSGCTFIANMANHGAGIFAFQIDVELVDCIFIGNSASGNGGGLFLMNPGNPTVTNCAFLGNSAGWNGGGIFRSSAGSLAVANSMFSGNQAGDEGGGMYMHDPEGSTVTNSTFGGNTAGEDGGAIFRAAGSSLDVTNCIFWGDTPNEIGAVGQPTVRYTDIQGGWSGTGAHNINADPLFVQIPDPGPDGEWGTEDDDYGDLRLQPGSPCIDAADNTAVADDETDLDEDGDTDEPIPFDLDANPRFIEDSTTEDCAQAPGQCGECPVVDMGAYEFQDGTTTCCPADLDGDGAVGPADLAELLGSWGPCPDCPADLDGNGQVGPFDLALLLGNWGPCS